MLSARVHRAIVVLVFASVSGASAAVHACDNDNPEQYRSDKTVWCVDPSSWSSHQGEIKRFFAYGDSVISTLTDLFGVTPQGLPFTIVARKPDGGFNQGEDDTASLLRVTCVGGA